MSSTLTPNMNLIVPGVGTEFGPTYALDINASLAIVDQHNHSNGNGVQITPAGLNINSALTLNNNFLTNAAGVTLTAQGSTPANKTAYVSGVDLYFVDGNGNNIQMTASGSVNATSSGISSGTATASFSAGVLIVNAASSTPANIQGGSLLLGNNVSGSKFLTLAPPASMAANFGLTLPSIPAAQQFLSIDTSGNIAGYANVSGGLTTSNLSASAGITGGQLAALTITASQIAANAVTTSKIIDNAVTQNKLAALPSNGAAGSGGYSMNSASYAQPTNQGVTFVCSGRPVVLGFCGDGSSNSYFGITDTSGVARNVTANFQIIWNSTAIYQTQIVVPVPASGFALFPPSIISCLSFAVTAGNQSFALKVAVDSGNTTLAVNNVTMYGYEA